MFPADLKPETVTVDFVSDDDSDADVKECVVTLPSIESTVAAPEAPAEPQA